MGTGGVGKTSLSLATAIEAAQRGKRVAALTVDPSKRLTSLLGLDADLHSWETLQLSDGNSLDIYHINPSELFQEFVKSHLKSDLYEKLLNSRIYQQISTGLRETHNFASIYKMVQVCQQDRYDFVVLDTPPCHQVVDFFASPTRLQSFFQGNAAPVDDSWLSWLQKGSARMAEGVLRPLVGADFVDEMGHFFSAITGLSQDVQATSKNFIELFQPDDAQIVAVFPPAPDKLEELSFLVNEISRLGYKVDQFVMNRAFNQALAQSTATGILQDSTELALYNYFLGRMKKSKEMLNKVEQELHVDKAQFSYIPDIEQRFETVDDVLTFARRVGESWTNYDS